MGFVALALSHIQPHDLSAAGLSSLTLGMITYRSKWSVQAHFGCNTSFFHKQKGFLQPAVTKHASSSTNATKAAPVHAEPALQSGEPAGDNRAELHSLTAVALGGTCKQGRSRGSAGQFLTALMDLCAGLPHTCTCLNA